MISIVLSVFIAFVSQVHSAPKTLVKPGLKAGSLEMLVKNHLLTRQKGVRQRPKIAFTSPRIYVSNSGQIVSYTGKRSIKQLGRMAMRGAHWKYSEMKKAHAINNNRKSMNMGGSLASLDSLVLTMAASLVDKVLKRWTLHHTDLENTVLAYDSHPVAATEAAVSMAREEELRSISDIYADDADFRAEQNLFDPKIEAAALNTLFTNHTIDTTCAAKLSAQNWQAVTGKFNSWKDSDPEILGAAIKKVVDDLDAVHLQPSGILERMKSWAIDPGCFGVQTLMQNLAEPHQAEAS